MLISKKELYPILRDFTPGYLTPAQLNSLILSFQKWYDESKTTKKREVRGRYWLVFLVLRFTGARIGEVTKIDDSKDIDFRNGEIRILNLKRRKKTYRQVFIPSEAIAEIATYLAEFPHKRGKIFKVDPSNFRKIFKEIALGCGLEKDLAHPHILRHTRAMELLQNNVPITIVQDQLGHTSLTTTAVYLKISGQEAKKILKERNLL